MTMISKNIVIHEKPKIINELKFKDLNLQDVDLTNKKEQYHDIKLFGLLGVLHAEEKCHLLKNLLTNILRLKFML